RFAKRAPPVQGEPESHSRSHVFAGWTVPSFHESLGLLGTGLEGAVVKYHCRPAADAQSEGRVMPLLPRSRRGTWLLAAAVWLAACAGLWWALPVLPRGEFRLPKGAELVSLGPGFATALVRQVELEATEAGNKYPFAIDLL